MWRLAAAALVCVVALGHVVAASAGISTADLIPTPSDTAWQPFPDGTMALTADEVLGKSSGDGFVDAYLKEWTQGAKPFALSDRLEHYSSIYWASYRLGIYRRSTQRNSTRLSFTEVDFGSGAFEFSEPSQTAGRVVWTFVFTKGDYLSAIAVDTGAGGPSKGTMIDQANLQLDAIPESVAENNALNHAYLGAFVVVAIVAGVLILIVLAIVVVLIIVLRRKRPQPAAASIPAGAQMSPDGRYWWDGASWRPRPPS